MMTIFGALIFVFIKFEVAPVLPPEKLENGRRDHKLEPATAEKNSFANTGVDKTGYNFSCG